MQKPDDAPQRATAPERTMFHRFSVWGDGWGGLKGILAFILMVVLIPVIIGWLLVIFEWLG